MDTTYKVATLYENRGCANFTNEGMVGVSRKNPDRPVSLMSLSARRDVNQAELRGLCFQKFTADITLDCETLPDTGTTLCAGDLKLGILPERKRCWPECVLLQEKLLCPLIEGVRYARVKMPGVLCVGDVFSDV